ncbi:MAG: hypothetical protein B6229_05175 [Spirochaetaceae bacterium 4572_7]|nr:MAG: hypothetical protein B6229_05175 [Spirochaetaceae bacterium 4572_7]
MKKILIIIVILFTSCNQTKTILSTMEDISPPILLSVTAVNENSIAITCNENVSFVNGWYSSRENIQIEEVSSLGGIITLKFFNSLIPGKEYSSEFKVEDNNGNSISFIALYYGYNSDLPQILINEFICKGTKTNPDKIELYITHGGDLAGVTIFNGTATNYDSMFTFPSIKVVQGEYIVVRSVSENYPIPFIELDNIDIEHDKKFIPGVRDLRVKNLTFSGSNGVITLYTQPFGSIIDAVVFTKNINNYEKNYRNFGLKKTLQRIDELDSLGEWIADEGVIYPEDAISITKSTTTRSLNRSKFIDKNSSSDWYIVPTKKSTFGFENSELQY